MPTPPDNDDAPDVWPARALDALALSWMLLFGGRGIAAPLLLASRLISSQAVEDFDALLGTRLYLILFSLTILVVALRVVRAVQGRAKQRD